MGVLKCLFYVARPVIYRSGALQPSLGIFGPKIITGHNFCHPTYLAHSSSLLFSRRYFSNCRADVLRNTRGFGVLFSTNRIFSRCGVVFNAFSSGANASDPNKEAKEAEDVRDEAKKHYTENLKRNTRMAFYVLGGIITSTIFASIFSYGRPHKDEDGNEIRDQFSNLPIWKQYPLRTWNEYKLWYYYIVEPSSDKLLPEPLPAPYFQPRFTLVLELNGVLIHPEWSYATGWRFKKRPALDKFVNDVGYPHFEVVVYTNEQGAIANPLLDNIDPEWRFMHRLYRDATKYMNRAHVKDLAKLNRDLKKVILVDWDPNAFQLNPDNALRIPKWEGDDNDRALIDLASLLLMIAESNVDDVRPILQYYSQFDDPIKAYVENRRKLLEQKMHQVEETKAKQQESLTKSFAGRLFGYRRHQTT